MKYNEKQLEILLAAEKLFSNKGFDGTSVRDIAEEASINIAMISYYFGSKEKLMQAIFEKRISHFAERIESLLKNETLTPLEKIYALIDEYIERVTANQEFYKLMICEQMFDKNKVVTSLLSELKQKNAALVEKLILEGQKKKVFTKKVDTVFLMNTLIGTVMQTSVNLDYHKNYHKQQDIADSVYQETMMKQLSNYIKELFKAILTHEN